MTPPAPTLRDYQRDCLDAIRASYLKGVRRQLVCLPTGTGKTVIFSQFPSFFRMKNRMLVLAHREELLDQARDKLLRANPDLRVGVEQAERRAPDDCQVVVASVATLGREGSTRLARLSPDDFLLIVVDEAHHATAATYRRLLEHFGVFKEGTKKLVVGFTATPKRGDGQGLDAVFEEIVFSRSLPEMVAAEYLAPPVGYRVETSVDLSGVKVKMGDFVAAQLSRAVNTEARNELVVKVHRDLLHDRPTLCFCVDVEHAESLAGAFTSAGVAAFSITGDLDRPERARRLRLFRAGEARVLTTCMVLTEGYDEPAVAGILLARPTRSSLLYTQMIGRGTRLHPGKQDVAVVDIVDVTREHPLITLPTLFGLSPRLDMKGRTAAFVERAFAWAGKHRPWVRTDDVTSLDELRYRCRRINLLDLGTPEEIQPITQHAWVQTGQGAYRLHLKGGEHIEVAETILDTWEVTLRAPSAEPRGASRLIHRDRSLARALRAAERFVAHEREDQEPLVTRDIRWRADPATERQRKVLESRHIEAPRGLTKGQASHVIAMLSAVKQDKDGPAGPR